VVTLHRNGYAAYPVGGGVRDSLLGRKCSDWDVATSAHPEQVMALFEKTVPTGIKHGTVTVILGERKVEVTTFRAESAYSDGRHPDRVQFLDSLEEDLKRRDFCINAMAYDLKHNRIIDPFGGMEDLRRGIIRAVGDPLERFMEDGLRPLRAIRFAAQLDFTVEERTFAAIGQARENFRRVAPERVREEILKLLSVSNAWQGVELLRLSGLMEDIFPELLAGVGFLQNLFHRYDVYQHTIQCLRKARGDGVLKLAVLLHDLGKPATAEGPEGQRTFYGHEKKSAQLARQIMQRLRFSGEEIERVVTLVENHMFHYEPGWTDGAVRRLIRRVGQSRLEDLFELRRADCWGRGYLVKKGLMNLLELRLRVARVLAEQAALKVTDLAVGGHDVMRILGCPPGPQVGHVLENLLELVTDNPSLNTKEKLEEIILSIGNKTLI
jgi:tRNA nucleotidyltransferase (CCA-adding enzyme)